MSLVQVDLKVIEILKSFIMNINIYIFAILNNIYSFYLKSKECFKVYILGTTKLYEDLNTLHSKVVNYWGSSPGSVTF